MGFDQRGLKIPFGRWDFPDNKGTQPAANSVSYVHKYARVVRFKF